MKLGDVLRKEREKRNLEVAQVAAHLGISEDDYRGLEGGESPAETWGPRLAQIAIQLETPTSRLLAESGRFSDTAEGQAGPLIRGHREKRGKSVEEMAEALEISVPDYQDIESGGSQLETYGPLFLGFAEQVEQPVFNLFYPCGLPFHDLDDYP